MDKAIDTIKNLLVKRPFWVIFALVFLLYGNTLLHEYALDDSIVILENIHTKKGIAGIGKIWTTDGFHGFFKGETNYITGGRYRPLSLMTFALEWQVFPRTPWLSHLINILLYGMVGVILFIVLKNSKMSLGKSQALFGIFTCLVFLAHPIHTEVVANIKGRDEILSLLFCLSSWRCAQKYISTNHIKELLFCGLFFALALFSKENAATFVAIIPLAIIFFHEWNPKKLLAILFTLVIPLAIFLAIWINITGGFGGDTTMEMMNNPFIKTEGGKYMEMDFNEKTSLISRALLYDLKLLFFPHPLTHDYYPRYFAVKNVGVIAFGSILIHLILLIFAVLKYRDKSKILSFSILYYFISLSIASNVVFNIGTNLSERFLFMPSIGFALFLTWILKIWKKDTRKWYLILFALIIISYSLKTVTRNTAWKNNYTLFSTDIGVSHRSAKAQNAFGGELVTRAIAKKGMTDEEQQTMLEEAIVHLDKAIEIHPNYRSPYTLKGNAYCTMQKYEESLRNYDIALKLKQSDQTVRKNYMICARQGGEYYGKEKNDPIKSLELLKKAEKIEPNDPEIVRLLGVAYAVQQDLENAIPYLEKSVSLQEGSVSNLLNLGRAYMSLGREEDARRILMQAEEIKPGVLKEKGLSR